MLELDIFHEKETLDIFEEPDDLLINCVIRKTSTEGQSQKPKNKTLNLNKGSIKDRQKFIDKIKKEIEMKNERK